ncbi:ComEA family DNA-binding protein [Actinomycetospora termitidis]|uniref:ComEA family DNA-binding protein n=1 Tax=Actinomycetospora termitidis TaxID=3053470 RepID=A0ABT7MHV9_9PSEU|nr:ComEA family DNA-binding protein [Actinomycetospora sp. Odt1-22]MDL5160031.1 ComEA family DNA-binding protein [Actinomycetospora sp. Odt1-22]
MISDPRSRLQAVVPDGAAPARPELRRGWPTAPAGTPGAGLVYSEESQVPEPTGPPVHEPVRASAWDPSPRGLARWLPASWAGARWDPGGRGALALAAVVLLAAVVAAWVVFSGRPVAEPVPALPVVAGVASAPSSAAAPAPGAPVVVHVAGKVRRPGLVTLADGARVGDAVDAAGGALPKVDLTPLNLAARVVDGQQIVVGAAPAPAAPAGPAATPGAAPAAGGDGKLDLNAATLEQLDGLPGVGPVTAKKILDWRTQNGRFGAVEQLREIPGIGEARFGTLRELVRV